MKKGFTLLELIVVIIILGILATLGLTQYGRMVERSRGAEAKAILGDIRKFAVAYYMEYGSIANVPAEKLGIGNANDQIPIDCRISHYFEYSYTLANPSITMTADRCTTTSKTPAGPTGNLILTSNLQTGVDTWGGNSGY